MRFLKGWARFLMVTVGIIALTSFTIDATDALRGSQTALSIFAGSAVRSDCPDGMLRIDLSEKSICVDIYENAVGESCTTRSPLSVLETKENVEAAECVSVSEADVQPWTMVTLDQAKTLCAKRKARLPSALEWYEASLGTPDSDVCNLGGNKSDTGTFPACVSVRGVHDMVGNVWEWIDASVQDGVYEGRVLPDEGYVQEVDASGVALQTSAVPDPLYNKDYFWHTQQGMFAMMRGGFYGGGEDSGLYAVHTKIAPSFSSVAIGFRCVLDI